MNLKGRGTYQTHVGACLSFFIILTVMSYSLLKVVRLFQHEEPDFVRNSVLKDMYGDFGTINAASNRFEFAFAFLSIQPYRYV